MNTINHSANRSELILPSPGELRSQEKISALIANNPAQESMKAIMRDHNWVDALPFVGHINRFGFSFLTPEAVDTVMRVTEVVGGRILSVFSGLGYAEAQLAAQGADVVGFDQKVVTDRWLRDIEEGPSGLDYSRYADRALFLSFPGRPRTNDSMPTQVVERFLAGGGEIVIVVGDRREHKHVFGSDASLYEKLGEAKCIETVPLPAWAPLVVLTQRRVPERDATLEPVLKVYQYPPRRWNPGSVNHYT
jgi:hypothetical protein